jgi:long-chain acyl-CoA synthetase
VKLVVQSRAKAEAVTGLPAFYAEDLGWLLRENEPLSEVYARLPEDAAELVYTSGTTGNPKGVVLSHANLITNLLQVNTHIPVVGPDFVFLSLLPLSHMFEQMGGFLTPLYRGASIVYIRTLKPSAILDAFRGEDIHAVICVPRLLQLLKGSVERELETRRLLAAFRYLTGPGEALPRGARQALFSLIRRQFGKRLSLIVSGGASLSPEIFRFWNTLGYVVLEGYGLTECAPVLTAHTMDSQVEGSVGVALPGVEIRMDHDEIEARGGNIFSGYYGNEEATREAFTPDGWFRTGDLGRLDDNGRLWILGRKKELIVTGAGINVYPDELEEILNGMKGVRESCVIGLDRGSGEEVHAVLIPDGSGRSAEEIVMEANNRLDPLHRITGFSIWPDPDFPKTTTMKIRKYVVRERLSAAPGTEAGGARDPLIDLIARIVERPAGDVREDSSLMDDLGLTSIGRLELVNCLEQEYRLDLDDSVITGKTTVGDLRLLIKRREKPEAVRKIRFLAGSATVGGMRRMVDCCFHEWLFRSFVDLSVSGIDRLREVEPPVMFIANHLSYLDHPAIMFSLPPKWRYTTATAAWEEFFFRNYRTIAGMLWKRFTYLYGTLFLNLFPLSQTAGFRSSLAFMGRLADHGINILIFPEGERSPDGRLLPLRPGIGIMAQELAVPLVPVHISGMEQVLPRGAARPRRGRVEVRFGSPLRFGNETPSEIVERARDAMELLAD